MKTVKQEVLVEEEVRSIKKAAKKSRKKNLDAKNILGNITDKANIRKVMAVVFDQLEDDDKKVDIVKRQVALEVPEDIDYGFKEIFDAKNEDLEKAFLAINKIAENYNNKEQNNLSSSKNNDVASVKSEQMLEFLNEAPEDVERFNALLRETMDLKPEEDIFISKEEILSIYKENDSMPEDKMAIRELISKKLKLISILEETAAPIKEEYNKLKEKLSAIIEAEGNKKVKRSYPNPPEPIKDYLAYHEVYTLMDPSKPKSTTVEYNKETIADLSKTFSDGEEIDQNAFGDRTDIISLDEEKHSAITEARLKKIKEIRGSKRTTIIKYGKDKSDASNTSN